MIRVSLDLKFDVLLFSLHIGKQYILALGEVYRAVGVLGASVMLYKPWILLNYGDFSGISALLDECASSWSNSGLEEALQSISNPLEFQYEETVEALVESIKHVYSLNAGVLQKAVFSCEEPVCHLSLLNPGTVPGMYILHINLFFIPQGVWSGTRSLLSLRSATLVLQVLDLLRLSIAS